MSPKLVEVAQLAPITAEPAELLLLLQDAEALLAALVADHGIIDISVLYARKAQIFISQARSVLAENDMDEVEQPLWKKE